MAEELKPCPFCGGGAEVVTHIDHEHDYNTLHTVGCSNTTCFGFAHPYSKCYRLYSDRERAIKEWNTRAERTCKMEIVKSGPRYIVWRFSCCGYEHSENVTDGGATELPGTRCPKCGTVVE